MNEWWCATKSNDRVKEARTSCCVGCFDSCHSVFSCVVLPTCERAAVWAEPLSYSLFWSLYGCISFYCVSKKDRMLGISLAEICNSGECRAGNILLELLVHISLVRWGAACAVLWCWQSGILSAYESIFVWFICFIALMIQRHFILSESLSREGSIIVGGCLGIIGILMPKLLESYEMLQAYCFDSSCGADNQLGIVQYEVAIAASASLATLFAVGVLAPTWKLWIFGLYYDDGRKSLGGVELQVAKESWLQDSSVSDATLRKTPQRNTIPHPLLEAAVSGVVAGVCLSIVSRLFGRR